MAQNCSISNSPKVSKLALKKPNALTVKGGGSNGGISMLTDSMFFFKPFSMWVVYSTVCDKYLYLYLYSRIPVRIFVLVFVFSLFCQPKYICIWMRPFFKQNIFLFVFDNCCQPDYIHIRICQKNIKPNQKRVFFSFTIIINESP